MTRQSFLAVTTALLCLCNNVTAFVAPTLRQATVPTTTTSSSSLGMMMDATSLVMDLPQTLQQASAAVASTTTIDSSNLLLSFTDQGQNLAGIFFQASLLPYLLFLYFLSFRANRIPALGNFGFQFVLLFVLSTIPSGIISKSVYGTSLANVDWLHGGAEALLTVANVMIVSSTCCCCCCFVVFSARQKTQTHTHTSSHFWLIVHCFALALQISLLWTGPWFQASLDDSCR